MSILAHKNPRFPGVYVIVILVILAFLVGSCKSTKKLVEKKEEKVSVLQSNDIKTEEQIKADVKLYTVSSSEKITITPSNNEKPARVIKGKDTMDIFNAKVVIENNSTAETREDKTITGRSSSDQSSKNSQSHSKEKDIDIEKKGTHPALIWGGLLLLLILIILVIARYYFKKKLPFL